MTSFELFVALRYLLARRKQAFISLISLISVLGVAVGVMALLIALALMTGVQGELRDRIIGSAAHVYVFKLDGPIENLAAERAKVAGPGVVGTAPAVSEGPALFEATSTETKTGVIKGIDPALEPEVTDIIKAME